MDGTCPSGCGRRFHGVTFLCVLVLGLAAPAMAETQLWVGAATAEITPERPVALAGQFHARVTGEAATPLVAMALVIEGRRGEEVVDQAVLVACDLVAISERLRERVRERAAETLPDLDAKKLILSATHTHTAPVLDEDRYEIPEGAMSPSDYTELVAERVIEAVAEAWEARRRATVSWGVDHAVTAYNRRAVYADGSAQMYGATGGRDFRRIEGPEDQAVESLFFWEADGDGGQALIATAINVASPSQQVEGLSTMHADFWHHVRERIRDRHGEQIHVLGWTGAAGDQAPRPMFRSAAEQRMLQLRGISRLEELARRIVRAWEDTREAVEHDRHDRVAFAHDVGAIELTPRRIAADEYERAKAQLAALADQPHQPWHRRWHASVVERYEKQQAGEQEPYRMPLHVLRIGDVAVATNDFELFTDFGYQMKARSPALQTFVIQLAGPGTYVPTEQAVRGGGYSAIAESNLVGPEGGQELVDQTVEAIEALWAR